MKNAINIILILSVLFISCEENKEKIKQLEAYHGPLVMTDSATTLFSDSAVVVAKIFSPKMLEYEDGNREYPDGVILTFYDKKGEEYSSIKANRVLYRKEKDLYIGYGDVVVENLIKKEKLNTEELHWKQKEEEIYTDKKIRIETSEDILLGVGLEAKQDLSYYKILKPTGTLSLEE